MALLDNAAIFHASGLCLWSRDFSSSPSAPLVDALVRHSLADNLSADRRLDVGQSSVRWDQDTEHQLIFMLAYPRALHLPYIQTLLATIKTLFLSLFGPMVNGIVDVLSGKDPQNLAPALRRRLFGSDAWKSLWKGWDEAFDQVRREVEASSAQSARSSTPSQKSEVKAADKSAPSQPVADAETIARNVAAFKARQKGGKGKKAGLSGTETPGSDSDTSKARSKMNAIDALDYSSDRSAASFDASKLVDQTAMGKRSGDVYEVAEYDYDDDDDLTTPTASTSGGFFARLSDTIGLSAKPMTRTDLAPALTAMQQQLMAKNVARDVAEKICEGVGSSLEGKRLGGGALTTKGGAARKEVRKALEASLTRILTPKTPTDVLLEATREARSHDPAPYAMVFVGVNGVGKSTTLSKVAFWLLQNGRRVLIAACDTFRSGAVEQLRIHVRNLGQLDGAEGKIELFEKGYGKDPAGIAKEAIAHAKANRFDVVLIDTAGRMQDNEPLMRALAKLVNVNQPDKVIFVGEALVGNEAVDQLTRFDRSMRDFSGASGQARGIDGIILSKFDTIDDKVGAAVSMSYSTGAALLFVGVGQTYSDLKSLRVGSIVSALLA